MKENFEEIKKYNFWNRIPDNLGFKRDSYCKKILDYKNSKLIKVLVGQRRAGKSYILRQIMAKLIKDGLPKENTLYINKEFTEFDFLKTPEDLDELLKYYKKAMKPKGKICIFIDEIQNIENWENFVNSHSQDFTENNDIYISGSNSKMLSGELATMLSGRYVKFEIFPFSFSEFCGIENFEKEKKSYIDYLNSGGLPELFILPNEESKRNYVSSVKDTVLLRDIIQRYKIKDPNLLEDLFVYSVNNASSLVSISNIVKYFKGKSLKTTYDTVSAYLGHMQDSYLIHKAERYDIRGKELLAGNSKYYINDMSYRNYLYSGFGYGIGYQLENLVYLELRRLGFDVYVGFTRNSEVDFVARKNDRIVYIQSCYLLIDGKTVEREYSALVSVGDAYEKYVVSLDDIEMKNRNGIRHIQAWNLDSIV